MKKIILLFLLLFFILAAPLKAASFPLAVANNKYGIHVADPNDLFEVAKLVNSSGGDWGYVTLVIQENDRNPEKWQEIFNQMRRLHLIPLVRLAGKPDNNHWLKPEEESLKPWSDFLSSLNWPVKNRYIIIFNEPNHSKEWGNTLDPEGYAKVFVKLAKLLKESSEDFFILPAGLDVSAGGDDQTLDAGLFWQRMTKAEPEFLNLVDGWTSHSYPNPNFSSSPYNTGRGSLQSYQWELNLLKTLGLSKDLPVFITETGWLHQEGKNKNSKLLSPQELAENIKIASSQVWSDPQIVSVTPFIFNYQDLPFDHFSFKVLGSSNYYPHYYAYQLIEKTKGQPKQEESYEMTKIFPKILISGSNYELKGEIKNLGQAILDQEAGYELVLESKENNFILESFSLPKLEPGQKGNLEIILKTPEKEGQDHSKLVLNHHEEKIILEEQEINLVAPISLKIKTKLGFLNKKSSDSVILQIFDNGRIVKEFKDLKIERGVLDLKRLHDLVPEKLYRLVLKVPYYLPKEKTIYLKSGVTEFDLGRFLPVDFNQDGKFSFKDFQSLFNLQPNLIFSLLF